MSNRDTGLARRRSRSPSYHREERSHKRSRSPISHHRHHHAATHRLRKPPTPAAVVLPLQASPISKHDFEDYKPMFGLYLDIQKHLVLEDLPNEEVRGRWKSFVGKWNRGDLAEGWYDPATLEKAKASAANDDLETRPWKWGRESPVYGGQDRDEQSSEDDAVGPALPRENGRPPREGKRPGPAIPKSQDLQLQRENEQEDKLAERQVVNFSRKLDRKDQKERLEDLIPRAEAGSKDRMLEKKREKADSNRAFASGKTEAAGVEEVPESDLLGDDGGIEGFKKQKREMERKKNDREIRREEILRARAEEREERIREYQEKEAKTMSGLVALAKARFG